MKNHYETLHVANFAEIEVVKAAYRAISKLYHPDTNSSADPSIIVKINLAYEVIGSEDKKREYDKALKSYLNSKCKSDPSKDAGMKSKSSYSESKNEEYKEEASCRKEENKAQRAEWNPASRTGKIIKKVGGGLKLVAHSVIEELNELERVNENAFFEGCDMTDLQLIRNYLKSRGAQRYGYLRVLKKRGFIYEKDGQLIPTEDFKRLSKF